MITKTEIAASRTDSITSKAKTYAIQRPARVAGQQFGISLDRTGWTDPTAFITINLEISQDGGATWRHWCGFTDRGGPGLPTAEWIAQAPPTGASIRLSAFSNGKSIQQPFSFMEMA